MDSDIQQSGGINVAADLPGFSLVNVEQILKWNPQVVLLNNFEPGLFPAHIYDDPRFAGLDAVHRRRVYSYPHGGFRWDPPSQETPLAVDWLFSLFYPHLAEPGLRQRVSTAYKLLYSYSAREEDIDHLFKLTINQRSAHYQALFGRQVP